MTGPDLSKYLFADMRAELAALDAHLRKMGEDLDALAEAAGRACGGPLPPRGVPLTLTDAQLDSLMADEPESLPW